MTHPYLMDLCKCIVAALTEGQPRWSVTRLRSREA